MGVACGEHDKMRLTSTHEQACHSVRARTYSLSATRDSLLRSFRLARVAAELALQPIEYPVDEALRVRVRKLFREIDRFIDGNDGRNVLSINHLEHRKPQDREIDLRNAIKLPVVRERLDLGINRLAVLDHAVNQFLAERIVFTRLLAVFEEDTQVLQEILR